ncbi:MAG: metallophosphoesterase [Phycisphaerales bacterium]|nr:metallophosphoesterase [Phycisphaerales bacterium]
MPKYTIALIVLAGTSMLSADVTDPLHPDPHPTTTDSSRFITNRTGAPLELPVEQDAFMFAIFGDRTGGPAAGIAVLADAVEDVNLVEPDFVMTVGDLINGYNEAPQWMVQMTEFKDTMNGLLMPWFPVAGNHDVYWRGEGPRPEGEHEGNYEMHFGPLWYAFEHKGSMFIVLYTDEGDPATGAKTFGRPEAQRMSPEQFAWLESTLSQARDKTHVFVFLHHPRWLGGGYGDDWNRVHQLLADAGNVRAVFAGHIHRMRYDGPHDDIEYVTLATVGGGQSEAVPEAGYLHQYHLVTVRDDQIALAAFPVGEIMDVRGITGTVSDETGRLAALDPRLDDPIAFDMKAGIEDEFVVELHNPVSQPIEALVIPHSEDSRWIFRPEHEHRTLAPGERVAITFKAWMPPGSMDAAWRSPELSVQYDYLAEGGRYHVPPRHHPIPMVGSFGDVAAADPDLAIELDGTDDVLRIPSGQVALGDGPMTLETWFRGDAYTGRRGLIAKTEGSEYGFFVSEGHPSFYIHLDGAYVELEDPGTTLAPGRWYHLAGVYDGAEVRLYLDGKLLGRLPGSGTRTRNELPLLVGADVGAGGVGTSFFDGAIDEVRLSSTARYASDAFQPTARHDGDDETIVLLHMDACRGPWVPGDASTDVNAVVTSDPVLVESGIPAAAK